MEFSARVRTLPASSNDGDRRRQQNDRVWCHVSSHVCHRYSYTCWLGIPYTIDDRFLLQIVYGLHSAILLPHIFVMDESPRWLWAQGRARESVAIIKSVDD